MPSPDTVDKAVAAIRLRADAYEYFFEHLNSPAWIAPLAERGFFADPPEPLVDGDFVQFPAWPESRYLVRVAQAAPKQVLGIIEGLPTTSNPRVHQDVLDAALAMGSALSLAVVPKVLQWLEPPYQLLLADKASSFAAQLAGDGHPRAAVLIGLKLLQVAADDQPSISGAQLPLQVHGLVDQARYEAALRRIVSAMIPVAPRALVHMLITLLRSAVDATCPATNAPHDGSVFWRPSIEDTEQNWSHDIKDTLVSALRDTATCVADMDTASRDHVLNALGSERWMVFDRVALHVIRVLGDKTLADARQRLLRVDSGNDPALFHEYWLLARDTFLKLTLDEQLRILHAMERQASDSDRGVASSDPYATEQRQYVRLLILTRAVLPPEWQDRFDRMAASHPLPEHPSFLVSHGNMRAGPISPLHPEDLLAFSDEELLSFLKIWQPSGAWMGESPEGLGQALTRAVKSDPSRFADLAPSLRGYAPTYVRGVLAGFREAVSSASRFEWDGVIALANWAVQQQPSERSEAADFDRDQGWSATRQTVAWMLSQGLEPGPQTVPYALRADVWEVLQPLTLDSDPTQDFESQFGGANMDPLTLSLNTVRGAAFHALISFALWVRRHIEAVPDSAERLSRGFDEMPEVRRVLEHHLDPRLDASPAIRSVYGQAVPFLVLMDSMWVRNHVESIFPNTQDDVELWRSAWLGYLSRPDIYNNVVAILLDQYGTAVARLFGNGDGSRDDPARLSYHLMAMYWRGLIDLNAPTSPLPAFWKRATGKERAEALKFVGLTFSRLTHASEEVLSRLVALWEFRTAALTGNTDAEAAEELEAFGWWFASGQFPPEWALHQLTLVLQRTGQAETNHLVLERVAELAPQAPLKCIELLSRLLQPPNDPYGVWAQNQATATILRAAINSADGIAQQVAIDLIHWLGVRGHLQYRDLLAPSGGQR